MSQIRHDVGEYNWEPSSSGLGRGTNSAMASETRVGGCLVRKLSDLGGLVVVERSGFPGGVRGSARRVEWDGGPIKVVQDELCPTTLNHKVWTGRAAVHQLILVVKDGERWVLDGHHALGAALVTGLWERLSVWEYDFGMLPTGVPKLLCGCNLYNRRVIQALSPKWRSVRL